MYYSGRTLIVSWYIDAAGDKETKKSNLPLKEACMRRREFLGQSNCGTANNCHLLQSTPAAQQAVHLHIALQSSWMRNRPPRLFLPRHTTRFDADFACKFLNLPLWWTRFLVTRLKMLASHQIYGHNYVSMLHCRYIDPTEARKLGICWYLKN